MKKSENLWIILYQNTLIFLFFFENRDRWRGPYKLICVTVSGPLITTQTGPNDV